MRENSKRSTEREREKHRNTAREKDRSLVVLCKDAGGGECGGGEKTRW